MHDYCPNCPRRLQRLPGKPGVCHSSGALDAPFLIVGMSPGEEEIGHYPFKGRSGNLLWGVGAKIGLHRQDCRIINVSECWPCGGNGKTLSADQIGACWNRFEQDLLSSQARVVICLGKEAMERVTGFSGIEDYRGYLFSPDQLREQETRLPVEVPYGNSRRCSECKGDGCPTCGNTGWKFRKGDLHTILRKTSHRPTLPQNCKWVIGTYHPSAVMRSGRKILRAFINDLDRAVRAQSENLTLRAYVYETRPTHMNGTQVAFDIENTGGLDGPIERIGFAGFSGVWTSPWNGEAIAQSKEILGNPDRLKIGHNLNHDIPHLEAAGVKVPGRIFDTMWAGMVLEPDLPMGLRFMVPLWLDVHGCWKDEGFNPQLKAYAGDPAYYNAHDAAYTFDLAQILINRHQEKGSYEPLMRLIMPSLRVLMDMHRQGMKVDLPWVGRFAHRLQGRRLRLMDVWHKMVPSVDPLSNQQCAGYLYGKLGLPVIKDPDNQNRPTTRAWAIKLLQQRHPQYRDMLRCLLALRKVEKLEDACGMAVGADGCVHPYFGPSWKDQRDPNSKRKGTTSTLRLSVAAKGGLNMQQMPNFARRAYIAPPGYVFLKADLDRAEPWIYAARSGDKALIEELTHGDPYLRVAQDANCSRVAAKALFLSRFYGAGERKGKIILATQHGIDADVQLVRRVFNAIGRNYPTAESYRLGIGQLAARQGYLTSGFGFVREFLGGSSDVTEAMDWEAQHHVACILWSLFGPLHEMAQTFHGWLAITVYDEAMICVPEEHKMEASRAMLEIMRTERPEVAPGYRPMVTEVLGGTDWRDLTLVLSN